MRGREAKDLLKCEERDVADCLPEIKRMKQQDLRPFRIGTPSNDE